MEIKINEKYKLVPLLRIDKEDIRPLFQNGRGVYICNFPDQNWYDFHGFERKTNYSIEKKQKFFELMGDGAKILSPTQDSKINEPTKSFQNGNTFHFGSRLTSRFAQVSIIVKIMLWLFKNRNAFDYILCYNFYPISLLPSIFGKLILRKRLIVDFEDDYMHTSKNLFYPVYFNIIRFVPNNIICINKKMLKYFNSNNVFIFNGFINLKYAAPAMFILKEDAKFLYAGALDDIRGVDLIPDIVKSIRKSLTEFTINITGSGILETEVKSWDIKEVNYLGFLEQSDYEKLISESDYCLVLQKMDHPFSFGSFPSKVEYYANHLKPIFRVECI